MKNLCKNAFTSEIFTTPFDPWEPGNFRKKCLRKTLKNEAFGNSILTALPVLPCPPMLIELCVLNIVFWRCFWRTWFGTRWRTRSTRSARRSPRWTSSTRWSDRDAPSTASAANSARHPALPCSHHLLTNSFWLSQNQTALFRATLPLQGKL